MANLLVKLTLFLLLAMPLTIIFTTTSVRAEDELEDEVEVDDDEATVETDEPAGGGAVQDAEEEEPAAPEVTSSKDAKTTLLFVQPKEARDLPAGEPVKILVGFENAGGGEFYLDTMEASFRYPQDFSYTIQNFTTFRYERTVEAGRQATLEYAFVPSDAFQGRPFGLVLQLHYRDDYGQSFSEAVFNETVTVVEPDVGLDGETFFMYVLVAAIVVLLMLGAYTMLLGVARRAGGKAPRTVETGTQQRGDVDYDWLPKETLDTLATRRSPRLSPGRRRAQRGGGEPEM